MSWTRLKRGRNNSNSSSRRDIARPSMSALRPCSSQGRLSSCLGTSDALQGVTGSSNKYTSVFSSKVIGLPSRRLPVLRRSARSSCHPRRAAACWGRARVRWGVLGGR
eukprot:364201-Chlamydomonas_euryale.AAC.21